MKESKFINKATVEYLKSKAGATVQQQIQNVKERIDLESNDLTQHIENTGNITTELTNRTNALGKELLNLQNLASHIAPDTLNNKMDVEKLLTRVKYLTIGLTIALLGVVACLVKSLI